MWGLGEGWRPAGRWAAARLCLLFWPPILATSRNQHTLTLRLFPTHPPTAGDVGRVISDYAAESKADAVVIGSRGLGAFRRRMLGLVGLGSVSDYVAHHAPCTGECLGQGIAVECDPGALVGWLACRTSRPG